MILKNHITGAELQTMREALHMSRDELAELAKVQARTVKHWENGRAGVPADVAALVQQIDARVNQAARQALAHIASAPADAGELVILVFTRYRTAADMHRYRPDMAGLPVCAQAAILARVAHGLRLGFGVVQGGEPDRGAPVVRVVWFDPASFEAWRKVQGQDNSEASRADWAAHELAIQAIPHRADQPPPGV